MKALLRVLGVIIGIIVLLLVGAYLIYNKPLPEGTSGPEADRLANKMLTAVGAANAEKTNILTWTFNGSHQYVWDRKRNLVEVKWGDNRVLLNLDEWQKGKAYDDGKEVTGDELDKKRGKAWEIFCNDSFWFIAPTKVLDKGVERAVVKDEDGHDALLVTYTSGGVTPGDSYLWLLDDSGLPKAFRLWVSIIPIGGLKATWEDWKTLGTGLRVATNHKLGPMILPITGTTAASSFAELDILEDPFAAVL